MKISQPHMEVCNMKIFHPMEPRDITISFRICGDTSVSVNGYFKIKVYYSSYKTYILNVWVGKQKVLLVGSVDMNVSLIAN